MAKAIAGRDAGGARPPVAAAVPAADNSPGAIRRLVARLAWPSIVENLLQSAYGIVLLLLVARLGPAAVAGFGAASGLTMVALSGFFALSMGATVLVAHATGAGTPATALSWLPAASAVRLSPSLCWPVLPPTQFPGSSGARVPGSKGGQNNRPTQGPP
jgi:MatE